MTVKFTRAAQTYFSAADSPSNTFPNTDWSVGFSFVLDGALANSTTQYFVSTGNYATPGSVAFFIETSASGVTNLKAYINGLGSPTCISQALTPGGAYECCFVRANNTVNVKCSPVLTTMPTTGASVVTGTLPQALSVAMDSTFPLVLGTRATFELTRALDHSAGRFFMAPVALSDLDIAKLAYGMEITDLGYTPSWYCRLNDANDFADRGNLALPWTKTGTPTTGASMGFGYVPTTSAPVFTSAPVIDGVPAAGSTATYTRGSVTASPSATITEQWRIDGATVASTPTTVLASGTNGHALVIRQIATNSEGTTYSDSAPVTIAAAANDVSMTAIPTEKIFSLASLSATNTAVPLSIAYTGTQPSSIEYQLYGVDRATVRQAWTNAGATIVAGGTATASPLMPKHAEKYTIALRTKDGSGNVLATSTISTFRFGIGGWMAHDGSSSSATWFGSGSGGSFTPNTASTSYADPNGFRNFDNNGVASQAAIYYAQQFGCCIGMLSVGVGGTTVNELANTSNSKWLATSAGLTLLGNKIFAYICSSGSNDASNNYLVTSAEQHLGKQRTIIANVRAQCGLPNLPVFWSGMNSRPGSPGNAAGQDPMSDWVRTAENMLGYDANVYHISALDFIVGSDGVHLLGSSFQAQMARIQYVVVEQLKNGVYRRGPRITAFTFLGNAVTATLEYRQPGANDFTPTAGAIGFTVTDANGTPGVVSVTRQDATHPKITFDRALVAPVVAKFLSGGAPPTTAPIYDNGAVPLPMTMEAVLATTAATSLATTATFSVVDKNGQPVTGLLNLDYAFYDQVRINTGAAAVKYGTGFSVNGGTATLDISGVTALIPGAFGRIEVADSDLAKIIIGKVAVT